MHTRTGRTALVAGMMAGSIGLAAPASAQTPAVKADSAPHFALFGGTAAAENNGPESGVELGGSGDFRWGRLPVPLRLSMSFSQRNDSHNYFATKGGKASLELVVHPIPTMLGIRPYFLGGAGVATRAEYGGWTSEYALMPDGTVGLTQLYFRRPRQSWAFGSVGMGVDIGRAFVQVKLENPVASQGPIVVPVSVGIRFWD